MDWGCGNGHFSYFLLRQDLKVEGFSLEAESNALAPYLRNKFPDTYNMVTGDLDNPVHLPFPDQSFDLAFSIGVLEHVRETGGMEQASLQEIVRVLRPGGHFVCGMLPKKYSWIEFLVRSTRPDKNTHLYRYTKNDIAEMMKTVGLELVKAKTHGFRPRNSWNHPCLKPIGDKAVVNRSFNAVDRTLAQCIRPIAQNFMFAARR